MRHELKIWPVEFDQVKEGTKTFEFRLNDRNFRVGDELLLKEWQPAGYYDPGDKELYTGEICHRAVTQITYGPKFGIPDGFCIMSISKI